MKNLLTLIFWIPAFLGITMLISCGNDNNTTNTNGNNAEIILDTNIVFTVPSNQSGGDTKWLEILNTNKIKIEYIYSISNSINISKLYLYLFDTSCCMWNIDSVLTFPMTPTFKEFTFNPQNGNNKKLRIDFSFSNNNSDTEYVKLDNFKVSKLY